MKALVSILILAYNAEKWIGDTLRSAMAQTYPHGNHRCRRWFERRHTSSCTAVRNEWCPGGYAKEPGGSCHAECSLQTMHRRITFSGSMPTIYCPRTRSQKQMEAAEQISEKRICFRPDGAAFSSLLSDTVCSDTAVVRSVSTEWLLRKMGQNLHMQTATWLVSRELTEAAGPGIRSFSEMMTGNTSAGYFWQVMGCGLCPVPEFITAPRERVV